MEGEVFDSEIHKQRVVLDPKNLQVMRRMPTETNPSLLKDLPLFDVLSD